MKCPKCRNQMEVKIAERKYVCKNENCKLVIEWVNKKEPKLNLF
jgi:hypothetical protein